MQKKVIAAAGTESMACHVPGFRRHLPEHNWVRMAVRGWGGAGWAQRLEAH